MEAGPLLAEAAEEHRARHIPGRDKPTAARRRDTPAIDRRLLDSRFVGPRQRLACSALRFAEIVGAAQPAVALAFELDCERQAGILDIVYQLLRAALRQNEGRQRVDLSRPIAGTRMVGIGASRSLRSVAAKVA